MKIVFFFILIWHIIIALVLLIVSSVNYEKAIHNHSSKDHIENCKSMLVMSVTFFVFSIVVLFVIIFILPKDNTGFVKLSEEKEAEEKENKKRNNCF